LGKYEFRGRVAVVTGAGRGIGRAYARLLAELGAQVVVNDLGGSKEGIGADPGPAQQVVAEIRGAGGQAVAHAGDISTPDGGEALIAAAIEAFGRIDIVINNAGTMRWGGLPEVDLENIEAHLAVHTKGAFNTVRAAWAHLLRQNYGRIVLTGSGGMFGLPDNLGYATAKAALIGMAKSLTANAGGHDIKINVIAPSAWTRLGVRGPDENSPPPPLKMEPELVAPMAAYLAHEACPVSGEVYLAGAGRFARVFLAATDGYLHADPQPPTIDDVAERWDRINDEAGYYVPASLKDWVGHYLSHLR
jgi:NAD(P)-dependent dehydrogenase (short-subunit alcohol dehydrogenase family)